MSIDSSVNQRIAFGEEIASGEIQNKYDSDSSVREVHRIIVGENRRQQRNECAHFRMRTDKVAINSSQLN